jgi:serine/threonine protein kinase
VWDYLRVRLKTELPAIDEAIPAGQPDMVEDLAVGAKLGEGSFGVVCRLMSPDGEQQEVLKMVDKSPITNFRGIASIKRQIRVMQMLSSARYKHPNITKLYGIYHTETHVLFRMEDGGPMDLYKRLVLRERGEESMQLGVAKVRAILLQGMAAICHLHLAAKVVHRDLKPENIIFSDRSDIVTIKLSDFDTAQVLRPDSFSRGNIGTFPFIAPEVYRDFRYSPFAADIWSMGVVFLEVMCGLSILKKGCALRPAARNAPKSVKVEAERQMIEEIHAFFSTVGRCDMLIERHLRTELHEYLDNSQVLHEGMLDTIADRRWKANELQKVSAELF